ncbi:TFIIB-type zinc ribbon-containing protein [Desulfogranum japonicum]|uniref:TFIIB-type zinc ribbon-containing protein n=1 Tax=Desulfogranum japonicum TaxID=231447 RepID=UPI00041A0D34|nr:zf-TFIIB domain-containing protein [Desulfogranum japonicum]
MKCPKCSNELSKKEYASSLKCSQCGGMWLAEQQFPKFIDLPELDDPSGDRSNDDKTGLCPEGHGILTRARIDVDEPFYLERCSKCGGIWFDQGEWHAIVQHNLIENLADFWCRSWQRTQRKQLDRATHLDNNKKLLGEELFSTILHLAEQLKHHPEKGRAVAWLQQEINEA